MKAVLQKLPLEAWLDDDRYGPADVLMVGTEDEAEAFLAAYKLRHAAACAEWKAWDAGGEWDERFDAKFEELCEKYQVTGCLIEDVAFAVVDVGV